MSNSCNYIKLGILIFGVINTTLVSCTPVFGEAPYLATLQRKIKKAWVIPEKTPTKEVKVRFTIESSGGLVSAKVFQSCGSAECDRAALEAIKNAAPFKELPENAPPRVEIEYTFDYLKEKKERSFQERIRQAQLLQPKVKTKKGAK